MKSVTTSSACDIISVAPLAGAWIEIPPKKSHMLILFQSLPLRERGLKSVITSSACDIISVAPLAGAWIEIFWLMQLTLHALVAPLAGAWIEIGQAC